MTSTFQIDPSYVPQNRFAPISEVPQSCASSAEVRPIPGITRISQVLSQSGTISSGGTMLFNLPNAQSYAKAGSFYLRFTVTPQGTATTGATIGFNVPSQSCWALFNRMTLYLGSQMVEQLNQYHTFTESLMLHATSAGYLNDLSVCCGTGNNSSLGTTNSGSYTFCMPLILGALNKQHLPLFLMGSGGSLVVDTNTLANAVLSSTTNMTDYQISNAYLCWEELVPDSSFIQSVKEMVKHKPWQMPFVTARNNILANSTGISQVVSLNVSSLKALLYTNQVYKSAVNGSLATYILDAQTSAKLYLDGRIVNAVPLAGDVASSFIEMNRALGRIDDVSRSSYNPVTASTYSSSYFLGGINTNKVADSGHCFTGVPVNTLVIELNKSSATSSTNFVTMALYDVLLSVDEFGVANIQL